MLFVERLRHINESFNVMLAYLELEIRKHHSANFMKINEPLLSSGYLVSLRCFISNLNPVLFTSFPTR